MKLPGVVVNLQQGVVDLSNLVVELMLLDYSCSSFASVVPTFYFNLVFGMGLYSDRGTFLLHVGWGPNYNSTNS